VKHKLLTLSALVALFTVASLFVGTKHVFAASGPCYFGPGTCDTSNTSDPNGDFGTNDIFPGRTSASSPDRLGGIVGATNKKAWLRNYINGKLSGTTHEIVGARFVMAWTLGNTNATGNKSAWNALMADSNSSVTVTVNNNVTVGTTSWYDSTVHDTFFDSYSNPSTRQRDVIDIRHNGHLIARIEIACGNLTGARDWGPMDAASKVSANGGAYGTSVTAHRGEPITWSHLVYDAGTYTNSRTPTIDGEVVWTASTTGPLSTPYRVGGGSPLNYGTLPLTAERPSDGHDYTYSQTFASGASHGKTLVYDEFVVPASASDGDKYCQRVRGSPTSTGNGGQFFSTQACITVRVAANVECTSLNNAPGNPSRNTATITFTGKATSTVATPLTATFDLDGPTGNVSHQVMNTPSGSYTVNFPVNKPAGGFTSGQYTAKVVYTGGGDTDTCTKSLPLGDLPYYSVVGGDIAAGPDFNDGSCTQDDNADIIGSNSNTSPYQGASGQLGALALRNIKSFVTGKSQSGGAWGNSVSGGSSPSVLAFANTTGSASPVFGGGFDQDNWCVADYAQGVDTGSATPLGASSSASLGSPNTTSVYTSNAPQLTLTGGSISADGRKVIIKADHDVYITGDITYGVPGSLDQVPQLEIIAGGNIYIDPSVRDLYGFYDAQGGAFITCANSAGAISGAVNVNTCKQKPLTVHGAVAALLVVPNRTWGDQVGNAAAGTPQQPAELFDFSPQMWLPALNGRTGVGRWESVTSLPPIL
jgi:hypothetical protein